VGRVTLLEAVRAACTPSAAHPCHEFGLPCFCKDCEPFVIAAELAAYPELVTVTSHDQRVSDQ
jgi:hypothetical protein